MRGIGTDGAATMAGCHNGVVARLERITPSAIGVHCAAHRLNLALSQAGNAVPYIKKINPLFIRYLISMTTVLCKWQAIQTLLQEKGRLIAPSATRWLSVDRSVNRLKSCFSSVVISLQREGEERSDAKWD